jgi:hypothetical protein
MEHQDYWAEDEFEDAVAAALIASFESKIVKNRGAAPSDRLTEERVARFRAAGPYLPGKSRLVIGKSNDKKYYQFDINNDKLPNFGCVAFRRPDGGWAKSPNDYIAIYLLRQVQELGKYWHKQESGALFEMIQMSCDNVGINGERRYFTITKNGDVVPCYQVIPMVLGGKSGKPSAILQTPSDIKEQISAAGSLSLQFLADKRFCWTITAQEKAGAKAHLGCMMEEVKSLLYARSLPMTATGRKRPILHLVESHKRRMRNGTDIDVTAFLRGQQTVEIGGTIFKVNPPVTLKPTVSETSQHRYFENSRLQKTAAYVE